MRFCGYVMPVSLKQSVSPEGIKECHKAGILLLGVSSNFFAVRGQEMSVAIYANSH